MAYCTLDDIKKLLPEESVLELTDDEALGSIVQGRVDEAIAQADAEIEPRRGKIAPSFGLLPGDDSLS